MIRQHGGKYSGFKSFEVLMFLTEDPKAMLFSLDLRTMGASLVGQRSFFSLI